jgi:hypothetical protein
MKLNKIKAVAVVRGSAAALLIVGTSCFLISRPASATPAFAAQTGKACGECHQSPSGGGVLTPFGEQFKANGNKLPK